MIDGIGGELGLVSKRDLTDHEGSLRRASMSTWGGLVSVE